MSVRVMFLITAPLRLPTIFSFQIVGLGRRDAHVGSMGLLTSFKNKHVYTLENFRKHPNIEQIGPYRFCTDKSKVRRASPTQLTSELIFVVTTPPRHESSSEPASDGRAALNHLDVRYRTQPLQPQHQFRTETRSTSRAGSQTVASDRSISSRGCAATPIGAEKKTHFYMNKVRVAFAGRLPSGAGGRDSRPDLSFLVGLILHKTQFINHGAQLARALRQLCRIFSVLLRRRR
ncbi:hypothetical protein EVAR_84850_1 [Eumeta japonica]|uniref:Uncharacterized protein n=1 Tax=Eumeta variegata TaxID=151549 RepID=A0A4C1ZZF6_EUMVA|nr:hypothetical protein EVAR_84850_1 [Eumeta japonica]